MNPLLIDNPRAMYWELDKKFGHNNIYMEYEYDIHAREFFILSEVYRIKDIVEEELVK